MIVLPSGKQLVEFLASRAEFVGVGKATATRLWDRFGTELYRLLGNGDVESLSEILDRSQAGIVVDAWQGQQALADCVVFFDEQGLDSRLARKALEFWGTMAVQKILDNPYRLLTVCSWARIDQVALRLGFAKDDPRRIVAAVESLLYERLDRKHTWCSAALLLKMTAKRLHSNRLLAEQALARAVQDGAALVIDGGYQPAGAAYMERYIEDRISRHIDGEVRNDLFLDGITAAEVDAFLQGFSSSVRLTNEQAAAVKMAMSNTFSLLIGGAGVGKTTALKAINDAARHFGMKVYQLAVAGRAASQMSAATGQPAQTIASWLRSAADKKVEVGRHTLMIIDEASMLDLPTLYRILFYLPANARLLLVGDTAQLPPIGFGLTLHKLVFEHRVPRTELTQILRATEETGIPRVSFAIREGRAPKLDAYDRNRSGCSFFSAGEADTVAAIEDVVHDLGIENVQIVAAAYGGQAGIDAVNQHFHVLNRGLGRPCQRGFAEGDPCIWLVNDYDRSLWNGSMGSVAGFDGNVLLAEFGGTIHRIAAGEVEKIDLAYCISVHKAQGSQFKNVLVPVRRSFNLDRAMLYTAVTRATERVVLVGSLEVFEEAAVSAPVSVARDVGLRLRGNDHALAGG